MARVTLQDACDIHVHSNPSVFERIADDVELARVAREAGMKAIILKSHHESTVSRAYHTMKQVPGIQVFGGLVLNHHVGGINPSAVEAALKLGAKQIWMPTYHSRAHADVYGGIGTYGYMDSKISINLAPITVLDEKGELTDETIAVLQLVKEYNCMIGTAHLSAKDEIPKLIEIAGEIGCEKVILTHPFFKPPGVDINFIKRALDMGAYIELCAGTLYPIPGYGRLEYYVEVIEKFGPNRIVISSDAGQPRKSLPPESIRVFAQCLHEKGISIKDLRTMMVDNYNFLLDIS
jgi:hypothetical protein